MKTVETKTFQSKNKNDTHFFKVELGSNDVVTDIIFRFEDDISMSKIEIIDENEDVIYSSNYAELLKEIKRNKSTSNFKNNSHVLDKGFLPLNLDNEIIKHCFKVKIWSSCSSIAMMCVMGAY